MEQWKLPGGFHKPWYLTLAGFVYNIWVSLPINACHVIRVRKHWGIKAFSIGCHWYVECYITASLLALSPGRNGENGRAVQHDAFVGLDGQEHPGNFCHCSLTIGSHSLWCSLVVNNALRFRSLQPWILHIFSESGGPGGKWLMPAGALVITGCIMDDLPSNTNVLGWDCVNLHQKMRNDQIPKMLGHVVMYVNKVLCLKNVILWLMSH